MTKNNKLFITIIICVTVLALAAIGGWVYIQQQQVDLRNKELQQQKELTEYEQEQINNRAEAERRSKLFDSSSCDGGLIGC